MNKKVYTCSKEEYEKQLEKLRIRLTELDKIALQTEKIIEKMTFVTDSQLETDTIEREKMILHSTQAKIVDTRTEIRETEKIITEFEENRAISIMERVRLDDVARKLTPLHSFW